MDYKSYLTNELPRFISQNTNNNYLYSYRLTKIKRFLLQTIIIFIFQYSTIVNLTFSYPALPMYPPMGIAFIMFYLFGNNSVWGLLLGGGSAYFLKGLPAASICFNTFADIGCSWLGAFLCQAVFSSDVMEFIKIREWIKFFKITIGICLLSSLIRMMPILLHYKTIKHPDILFYHYINVWLADLNAILVLFGFVISWLSLFYSRGNITNKALKKLPIIIAIVFIIFSVLFMKRIELIYLIIFAMIGCLYLSYIYGNYIATGLLYIVSFIYLTYFIAHKQQYFLYVGVKLYMLTPMLILLFTVCVFYIAQVGHLKRNQ